MTPRLLIAVLTCSAIVCVVSPVARSSNPPVDDHDLPSSTTAHDDHAEDHHDDEHDHSADAHADEVKLTEAAIRQSDIRLGAASLRPLTASFTAPARVSFNADAMAHVGSVVQGRVVEIKVRVGDRVAKDDVLLIVESPELGRAQSEFLQRRTEAEVAAATVAPAKDAFDRAKKLLEESQGISLSELQKRDVEYRAAVGAKATTEAAMQAAENELHLLGITQDEVKKLIDSREINPRYHVRASIPGQVIEREVTLGELVSPDKEKLMVLADTTVYWVLADVPEARLGEIGIGSKAEVFVAAMPGAKIEGEVSLVAAEVDPNTRAGRVRIVVDNANGRLKPGMFARVVLFAEGGDAVLAIPEEAVQTIEDKPSVFVPVAGEPNTFARREVVVGRPISGYLPVLSGLKQDESIVVNGTFILKAELGKSEASHAH